MSIIPRTNVRCKLIECNSVSQCLLLLSKGYSCLKPGHAGENLAHQRKGLLNLLEFQRVRFNEISKNLEDMKIIEITKNAASKRATNRYFFNGLREKLIKIGEAHRKEEKEEYWDRHNRVVAKLLKKGLPLR